MNSQIGCYNRPDLFGDGSGAYYLMCLYNASIRTGHFWLLNLICGFRGDYRMTLAINTQKISENEDLLL